MRESTARDRRSRRDIARALAAGALALGIAPLLSFEATMARPETERDLETGAEERAMTATQDTGLDQVREQVRLALAAMAAGDPGPYIDLWADRPDVTLFGAWGPIEQGHQDLTDTFRWVGSRFSGGPLMPEDTVVHQSGDLAYTVGFERGQVGVDGGELRPMTIRVTHIYCRSDDRWQLVHRHADFPPADQRPGR